jgi:cyclopropane-fatty-acyl-phospholipid synthase
MGLSSIFLLSKVRERIWACLKPGGRVYMDAAAALQKYDVNDFARNYISGASHVSAYRT